MTKYITIPNSYSIEYRYRYAVDGDIYNNTGTHDGFDKLEAISMMLMESADRERSVIEILYCEVIENG